MAMYMMENEKEENEKEALLNASLSVCIYYWPKHEVNLHTQPRESN